MINEPIKKLRLREWVINIKKLLFFNCVSTFAVEKFQQKHAANRTLAGKDYLKTFSRQCALDNKQLEQAGA